ncbi:hypothetical protein BGY98DRAFT_930241 [Russula aff. rugulosa BPL654]|nr:hypothetical protein BGY98DRAFT_930241 [Russula aff. rugulosa BPL654]
MADNPASHPSSLSPPTDAAWVPHPPSLSVLSTKETPSSVSGTATNHKVNETSSPSAPSRIGRRTPNITVEYFKPLRQSIKRLPRKAEVYATAAKDPFVPSTQALGPPSSRNASMPSGSQQKATLFVPPTYSRMNRVNLANLYADPNPNAVLGTGPTVPLDGLPDVSFPPTPADRMNITPYSRGGSVTTKGRKGMLDIITDFLKSLKRPEISRAMTQVPSRMLTSTHHRYMRRLRVTRTRTA